MVLWDSCVLETDIGEQTERMGEGGGAVGQLCIRDAKYLRRVTQEFTSLVSWCTGYVNVITYCQCVC